MEEGLFIFAEMSNTQTHLLINDCYRVQYVEIQSATNFQQLTIVRREINSYNHIEYDVRDVIGGMRNTEITLLNADLLLTTANTVVV